MPRIIRVAAAQVGAVHRNSQRKHTMERLLALLETAAERGAQLVLFPECTFTTFFPRYLITDPGELDSFFEHGDVTKSPNKKAIFDKAKELVVDICIGFAEAADNGERYNTCVFYHARSGSILSRYRKIHLPGDFEPFADPEAVNQLEKRYFKPGDLGFKAFRVPDLVEIGPGQGEPILGMMICNDRRWAEAWRCLGLQGVEIVLTGFNTPGWAPQMWGSSAGQTPKEAHAEAIFHHKLVMQAHSYTNACFSVSAARCGMDDGKFDLVGGSTIVGPDGKIIAESQTEEDEVILADCDLDLCSPGKKRTFDFARHRRTEHYGILTSQTGVVEPPVLSPPAGTRSPEPKKPHVAIPLSDRSIMEMSASKPLRVLLCNPNSTEAMTDACIEMVRPTLPSDVIVHGFTAPKPSPSAIEGNLDNILSAAVAARAILSIADKYDAFLVACYSDHALTKALREELKQPVIGIMEASLYAARMIGGRFGIIATSERTRFTLEDSVKNYGLTDFCVGVRACDIGVLELGSKPAKDVQEIMCRVGKSLVEDGADVLTLGCAGMMDMKTSVEEAVGEDVQVVDGVLAGVQHLVGLCRMGAKTAKRGMFAGAARDRERRGQNWL